MSETCARASASDILLPASVDLLVLNGAPLELAGRVSLEGVLLFDDDPAARVHWLAQARKMYADERPSSGATGSSWSRCAVVDETRVQHCCALSPTTSPSSALLLPIRRATG